MHNSKLLRLFFVLKEEELKAITKWISVFFSQENAEIMRLYHILCALHPECNPIKLKKETIFKKIFPGIAYNDVKMRKMMHLLLKCIEEYIIFHSAKSAIHGATFLIEFYRKRYVAKGFSENIANLEEQIKKLPLKNANYFEKNAILFQYKSFLHVNLYPSKPNQYIIDQLENEQIAFFASQLQLYFSLQANAIRIKSGFSKDFLLQLLNLLNKYPSYLEISVIRIYYNANQLLLFEGEDNPYLGSLRQELANSESFLNIEERTMLAVVLRNFTNIQIRKGNTVFREIRFQLFLEHTEMGLIYSNNHITSQTYNSIVSLGLKLNKYTEVAEFAEKYKHKLPPHLSDVTYHFCQALLSYHQKDYDTSLKYLQEVESKEDDNWEIAIRILRIKLFYYLQETELAIANISALKIYLFRQKKITDSWKKNGQLFVNFALRILGGNENTSYLEKLKAEIDASICTEKEWLLSILPS